MRRSARKKAHTATGSWRDVLERCSAGDPPQMLSSSSQEGFSPGSANLALRILQESWDAQVCTRKISRSLAEETNKSRKEGRNFISPTWRLNFASLPLRDACRVHSVVQSLNRSCKVVDVCFLDKPLSLSSPGLPIRTSFADLYCVHVEFRTRPCCSW